MYTMVYQAAFLWLVQDFPSSPAELLRFINSEQYKAAADEQLRLVKESFRVSLS